ncbi:hypothetical protein [Gangjinia marincola]
MAIEKKIDIPIESSLGHLAYGDLIFERWRALKKKNNKDINFE